MRSNNTILKNSFQENEENVYLMHLIGDSFSFLGTKSNEIIKKINTTDLSMDELSSLLEENEKMGFVSYLIIKEKFFGYGATMLAPKVNKFISFMNKLLACCNHREWEFCVEVLQMQATSEVALEIPHLSKTTIQLSRENGLAGRIYGAMGLEVEQLHDVGDMEIVIKPRDKGGNIKDAIDPILNSEYAPHFNKFVIRAKDEVASALTDLYIVGKGAVCDFVNIKGEARIPDILEERIQTNPRLMEKVGEYEHKESFQVEIELETLDVFANSNSWSSCSFVSE